MNNTVPAEHLGSILQPIVEEVWAGVEEACDGGDPLHPDYLSDLIYMALPANGSMDGASDAIRQAIEHRYQMHYDYDND